MARGKDKSPGKDKPKGKSKRKGPSSGSRRKHAGRGTAARTAGSVTGMALLGWLAWDLMNGAAVLSDAPVRALTALAFAIVVEAVVVPVVRAVVGKPRRIAEPLPAETGGTP